MWYHTVTIAGVDSLAIIIIINIINIYYYY